MSHTWTPTDLASNQSLFAGKVWRCIPHRGNQALSKIVKGAEDIDVLANLIQGSKKKYLPAEFLDYDEIIYAPFEYGPWISEPSRFRPLGGHGVFYGAFDVKTALIEQAWHKRKFVSASEGLGDVKALPLQVFEVSVETKLVDTQLPPFDQDSAIWLSPRDYSGTQAFAKTAKDASLNAIKYASVRNIPNGQCLAVLSLKAITSKKPHQLDGNWWLSISGNNVNLIHDKLLATGDSFSHRFSD